MQNKDFVLGIDTSNYTTSLAITDINGVIVIDSRKLLTVKQGERGLRQSYALFQHMENLPEMLIELFGQIDKSRIGAVAASDRPRPVEGSYMPVFKSGVNYGKVMAAGLGVPFFRFSHQEGHLEAVRRHSSLSLEEDYLAYHLSGGTCELLHVKNNDIQLLGGSRNLSFGQVLDRIGVALGMEFPAGREMDHIALKMRDRQENLIPGGNQTNDHAGKAGKPTGLLKRIPIDGFEINLSGIETQCRRELEKGAEFEALIYELFLNISDCICKLTEKAVTATGCDSVLFTGGVTASRFIRDTISGYFGRAGKKAEITPKPVFGDPALSSDNAMGISFLGGKELWQSNR